MKNPNKLLKYALPIITVLMVAFIWGHSMMPGDTSSSESDFVYRLLISVFGDGTITTHLVRKTAHFTEYMVLGMLCFIDFALLGKKGVSCVLSALYICLFVAVGDESIQLFTVDRNGALFDVWLDHCGSITGNALCSVISLYRKMQLKKG